MKPDVPRWAHWLYYAAALAALTYTVYCLHDLMNDDTDDDERHAQTLMWASRVCQRIASVFGEWGLKAEVAYKDLMEQGRMN